MVVIWSEITKWMGKAEPWQVLTRHVDLTKSRAFYLQISVQSVN